MKNLFVFLLLLSYVSQLRGQLISVSERDLFRAGNINLVKLVADNQNYKGSPYLNDDFEKTALVFDTNRGFEGQMRYHMGYQIFEFENETGTRYKILPDSQFRLIHQGTPFVRAKIALQNYETVDGVFQVVFEGQQFRLLHYLKKELEQPRKDAIPAPASGGSEGPLPTWVDRSFYIITKGDQGIQVEGSHKKMLKLKFFDAKTYQTYVDQNKVKLKNEEMLRNLVQHLDQNTP